RNKLAKHVFDDLVEIWNEPISAGSDIRRGPAALRIMSKQNPRDFCRLYGSLMPKEFWISSNVAQLCDRELDRGIGNIRIRLLEQREQKALDAAVEIKMIPHATAR